MFGKHCVKDGDDPIFEFAVVVVGDDEITDTIHAGFTQCGTVKVESAHVGRGETFDEIFLDPAGGCDNGGDVGMLSEVAEGFAKARGDEVGCITEEDGGFLRRRRGICPCSLYVFERETIISFCAIVGWSDDDEGEG